MPIKNMDARIMAGVLEKILKRDSVDTNLEMALISDAAKAIGVDHEELMSYVDPGLADQVSERVRSGLRAQGLEVPPPLNQDLSTVQGRQARSSDRSRTPVLVRSQHALRNLSSAMPENGPTRTSRSAPTQARTTRPDDSE